jgi:eukaryotic-like serine/threonine-protein kinase
MLGLACFLVSVRPRDRSAVIASLFFAGLSSFNIPETLTGVYTMLRQLPTMIFALFYISWVAAGLTAPLFFTFCATFPRPLFRSRRLWMLIWMPYLLLLAPLEGLDIPMIFDSHHAISAFSVSLYNAVNVSTALYFVAGVFAVVANYRRLTDVNERRRIRVVVLGSVVGLLALTPLIVLFGQPGLRGTLFGAIFLSPAVLIASVIFSFLVFPLSFVYSILRHRLFDLRIIIRQGLRYAMARGVLLSIIPLLVVTLLVDILLHGDQSLAIIVTARGWIYCIVAAVVIVVYQKRQQWLDRIDRHFFRDRFDAQRLLQDVIPRVQESKSLASRYPN